MGWRAQDLYGLITSPHYPEKPDTRSVLPLFDAPTGTAKDYGQRLYGWFRAPETGNYNFFTSCSDSCELYMSQDDQEANKRKIISQMSPSGKDEYDKYDNKIS